MKISGFGRASESIVYWDFQERNVLFGRGGKGVHVILALPVKRRRALVATNPIEE